MIMPASSKEGKAQTVEWIKEIKEPPMTLEDTTNKLKNSSK